MSENARLGAELAAILIVLSLPFVIPFLPNRWLPKWLRRKEADETGPDPRE
ncbi:MAG TPA: hypothetical protein VEJ41_03670 [Candidatus Acidoferrales bacterium]|nr:hypothetical protein [Candidatus Acidoferrales bacterium]